MPGKRLLQHVSDTEGLSDKPRNSSKTGHVRFARK